MKASTGNTKMDILLNGGFERGSNIVFMGRSFTGAELFPIYFLARGTTVGDYAVVVTVDKPYDRVRDTLHRFGADMNRVWIIDLYSLPLRYVDMNFTAKNTLFLENRYSDDSILHKIKGLVGEHKPYRILLPISSLLLRLSDVEVTNLVERVSALVRRHYSLGFYTINTGMHGTDIIERFLRLADSYFEFSSRENTNYFRIVGMSDVRTRNWIAFSEEMNDISLESFALSKIK